MLVPVGHLLEKQASEGLDPGSEQDWQAMVNIARGKVIDTIEARTGAKIRHSISHEEVNTPITWKEKFNLDKGAILGLSHSFFNVLSFRPGTKHTKIEDLYFVGASTHPGTGVPICLAGSKIVAEQILDHIRVPVPWTRNGFQGLDTKVDKMEVKEIDRIRNSSGTLPVWLSLVAILLMWIAIWTMRPRT